MCVQLKLPQNLSTEPVRLGGEGKKVAYTEKMIMEIVSDQPDVKRPLLERRSKN